MRPASDPSFVTPSASDVASGVTLPGDYEEAKALAVRGGSFLFARQIVFGLVSLVGSTFLIRQLGAADWATYSVAYFLAVFFSEFFGATVLGTLIHGTEPPSDRLRQGAVRLMQVVGLGVGGLIALISVPAGQLYGDQALTVLMLAVAVCAIVYAVRSPAVALLERRLDYRWVAAGDLVDQLTFYVVAIPLVITGFGLGGIAVALAVRGVVSTGMLVGHSRVPLRGRWHGREIRELLRFAAPSLGSSGLILLNGLIPAIVLGAAHAEELAFIVASATILGYAASVQLIVQRVGFPGLSRLRNDPGAHTRALQRTLSMTNLVMVSVVVPLGALSPLILPFLFGPEWEAAVPVFLTMAAGVLLSGVATLTIAALNSVDAPRSVLRLWLVTTLTYLALALALTPLDALLGTALAYAASRALSWLSALTLLHARNVRLSVALPAGELLGGVTVMSGLAALFQAGHLIVAVGLLVLAAVPWGVLKREEFRSLLRWARRQTARAPEASG